MYIDILCGFSSNTRRNNNVCLVLFFFSVDYHCIYASIAIAVIMYITFLMLLLFFFDAAAAVVVVIVILVNISEKKVDRLPQDECQEIDAIYKQSFWFFSRLFHMN